MTSQLRYDFQASLNSLPVNGADDVTVLMFRISSIVSALVVSCLLQRAGVPNLIHLIIEARKYYQIKYFSLKLKTIEIFHCEL